MTLPQEGVRAAPTRIRVQTESGSATSPLQPNGRRQTVKAPAGNTSWLRVTILGAQAGHTGLAGAGFSDVDIPGVRVTRLLRLPQDSTDAQQFSFHATTEEPNLGRRFTTAAGGTYTLKASARPAPGDAFDKLLYEVAPDQRRRITATADSTSALGGDLSARNLTDGDLTTAWIAGDRPTLHLRWPDKQPVGEVVLAAAGGLSTRPEKIEISSPDGAAVAGVDENGVARFDPITTDRLDITVTATAPSPSTTRWRTPICNCRSG